MDTEVRGLSEIDKKLDLEKRIRHLENELHVTKIERERITSNYYELIKKLENEVNDKTYELKLSRAELVKKNRQLQILFDSIPAIVYQKDNNLKYLQANVRFTNLFGFGNEDIIGKTDEELFYLGSHFDSTKDLEVIIHKKAILSCEEVLFDQMIGKRYFWVDRIPEIDQNGNLTSIIVLANDITSLKKSEDQRLEMEILLQNSKRMESLGLLAGGIAHDFNNILGRIIGYTEIAISSLKLNKDNLSATLEKILGASLSSTSIVKQLLAVGKKTEGKDINFHIIPIINNYIKILQPTFTPHVKITARLKAKNDVICGEPSQIQQIILNLCTNAFYATKDIGDTIQINLSEASISEEESQKLLLEKTGDYLIISVEDNGSGIPDSIKDSIFDPYFSTKGKEGTGLGLSVVHGIVQKMNGAVKVRNSVPRGTIFEIYIPATESLPIIHEAEEEYKSGTGNILFVDDVEDLNRIAGELLGKIGYNVITFCSGNEALNYFISNNKEIDMVITNLNMPDLRGDQLAEKILTIDPNMPVILTSGYTSEFTDEKVQLLGVRKVLLKPILFSELASTVADVFLHLA
ncbi:MAG: ATP-binding protein [Candidatus Cloacimonetes bacterium]|nr:ATP-binding protein [Candidatus Cloacimonadota bacterium]